MAKPKLQAEAQPEEQAKPKPKAAAKAKGEAKAPDKAKAPAKAKKKPKPKSRAKPKPRNRAIPIAPVWLPEFDMHVSWAMCRNPMCSNFGVYFENEIPKGRNQVSDDLHCVRIATRDKGQPVGEIQCRVCKQSARLASNRAIRPIARYFLSLSLPFAACPKPDCVNHGVNLFEHWGESIGRKNRYRRVREHGARCNECEDQTSFPIGAILGQSAAPRPEKQKKEEIKQKKKKVVTLKEKRRFRDLREVCQAVIDGARTSRSVTDTIEISGIGTGNYYRYLERIGSRLRDYHSYRNARLLHRGIANSDKPIRLYTDVLDISLRANRHDRRHTLLKVILTAVPVGKTIFILAAHPYFLPKRFCPDVKDYRADRNRLHFETEWGALHHPGSVDPMLSTEQRRKQRPDIGRGGYFIRSPYAELAHFLVVRKMLARFGTIHAYMDSAKELYNGALVGFRDPILAGRPDADTGTARRKERPARAEIVLFQHDKKARQKKSPATERHTPEEVEDLLTSTWNAAEERFDEQEVPDDLLKGAVGKNDPKVRAQIYRRAYKGAYSEVGGWAWLDYPPPNPAYHRPRSLWLTRMPGKTFAGHGRIVLKDATLQPVDSIFNSIRARTSGAGRPTLRAVGRSYRGSYVLPAVVMAELAIYLVFRNYGLRRKTRQTRVPAEAMGLLTPLAAEKATTLDLLEIAWKFRLGITHAKRITRWRKS